MLLICQVITIKEKQINETYYELIEITGQTVAALICSNLGVNKQGALLKSKAKNEAHRPVCRCVISCDTHHGIEI